MLNGQAFDTLLNKAIQIACRAHAGQQDKAQAPYILHPLRVMMACQTPLEQICAVLHDVVEDSPLTFDDLQAEGFSQEILSVLDCLTRRKNEPYEDFIQRILTNPVACRVKLADLADNMDLSRIPSPTTHDLERNEVYRRAVRTIRSALAGNTP